jgi:hypothetical protein
MRRTLWRRSRNTSKRILVDEVAQDLGERSKYNDYVEEMRKHQYPMLNGQSYVRKEVALSRTDTN